MMFVHRGGSLLKKSSFLFTCLTNLCFALDVGSELNYVLDYF